MKVVEGLLPDSAKHFQNPDSDVQRSPTQFVVTGKLSHPRGIEVENFKFLAAVTKHTAKQCIPSPSLVHFRTGRGGVDKTVYPDMEEFFADLARVFREEIAQLAAAGCTYLEIDDVNFAYLCDPKMREGAKKIGEDPDKLPALYANLINECIKDRPANMSVCTHLCRGNFCQRLGRRRRLRSGRRSAVQRAQGRRLFFGIRHAARGQFRAAALLTQRIRN